MLGMSLSLSQWLRWEFEVAAETDLGRNLAQGQGIRMDLEFHYNCLQKKAHD